MPKMITGYAWAVGIVIGLVIFGVVKSNSQYMPCKWPNTCSNK